MNELEQDVKRVYGEYHDARAVYEKTDPTAPGFIFIKKRFDAAQQQLADTRALWRQVGQAAGDREFFVKTEDNASPGDSLIPDEWTERRHHPKETA